MAFVLKDRVKETTTTTGTGSVTLAGASTGFQSFNSAIGTSNTTYYCIAGQGTSEWEVGLGTLSASTTLARTTVYASSNAGSLVNFSAGTKDVFVTFPASVAIRQDQYALYTSGTSTWTAPTGVSQVRVSCFGGGGGGNTGSNDGGFGGVATGIYTVVPGTGYSVTVGAGGAAASTGGTSSFSSFCSATGGSGAGVAGSGSSGTFANTSVLGARGISLFGGRIVNASVSGSATTWTAASGDMPGAGGNETNQAGGTGGAVLIEYVG